MSLLWGDGTEPVAVIENPYLEEPETGLKLMASLIGVPEKKPEVVQLLEGLNRKIHYDFLELCGMENLPNEAEVFQQLEKAFADLEDKTEFAALANKNIVAVGGGFSSGKSKFLNSILKDDILPTDPRPTTVIPTYISSGEEERIYALNHFKHKVPLDRDAVKAVSHEFYENYKVGFSHIIEIMMVEKEDFPYNNIAFLDTPGYTKSDALIRGDNTDENKARQHLAGVEHLIWVVNVEKGTLPESDVAFLKQLNLDRARPIFVVLNKADLREPGDVAAIMEGVKKRLQEEYIPCAGIVAYNSRAEENHELMGDSVQEFLQQVNGRKKCTRIKQGFEQVFETFIQYNLGEKQESDETLRFLNTLYLRGRDVLSEEEQCQLKTVIELTKRKKNQLNHVVNQFETMAQSLDQSVDEVITHIDIVEEDKTERGLVGYLSIRDEKVLANLAVELTLEGKISRIDAFGVYVDCGLGDSAMIHVDEVLARYAHSPKEIFRVGQDCRVQLIEVNRGKKTATIVALPEL